VARIVDEQAHAARRDAFLDSAQRLVSTKSYARMSVQDVLAEVETSKGAFYHYFDSKQALLEAMIERLLARAEAQLTPIIDDTESDAIERLQRFFDELGSLKAGQRDFLLAMLRVWQSDDNAVVRQKVRAGTAERISPLVARVIQAGIDEGAFHGVAFAEQTGRVVVSLMLDLADVLRDLLLESGFRPEGLERVERTIAAYTDAIERVVGVPAGSLVLTGRDTLRGWFAATEGRAS
jgi:AcrR family transcriptional regulator